MTINLDKLLDGSYKWLRDKTAWKRLGDWVEITTPYLDRHNDYIQLYLKKDANGYTLTDDSDTIDDLEQSGYSLDSRTRQTRLQLMLRCFGVQKYINELFIKTSEEGFPEAMHSLIQAILAVQHSLIQADLIPRA